jgi:diacylglycerol kinase (ATP)
MKKEIAIICNPISGKGRSVMNAEYLGSELRERGYPVREYITKEKGEAKHIASQLYDIRALVVAGGDGTLNEVVNGMKDTTHFPILPLSSGTANMYARELGLRKPLKEMANIVDYGREAELDLFEVGYTKKDGTQAKRRALMIVSCGFDSYVTEIVKQLRKDTMGFFAYISPIIRAILTYTEPELKVIGSNGEENTGGMVVISNTKNYAGFFSITDKAVLDSGVFDIVTYKNANRLSLIKHFIKIVMRNTSKSKSVVYRTDMEVKVESDTPFPVQIDGDCVGMSPFSVKVMPKAIRVLVQ